MANHLSAVFILYPALVSLTAPTELVTASRYWTFLYIKHSVHQTTCCVLDSQPVAEMGCHPGQWQIWKFQIKMNPASTSRLHSASSETSSTQTRHMMYDVSDAKKVLTKTYQVFWGKKARVQLFGIAKISIRKASCYCKAPRDVTLCAKASWTPLEDNSSTRSHV